jgi:serine/threonine-protein kinase
VEKPNDIATTLRGHDSAQTPVELEEGAILGGRYRIERAIGRGGSGVVLRAFDQMVGEAIALKVLHPELAREARWIQWLGREVRLARKIRHPHVCRVFDLEQADGHTFITMELAEAGTLRARIADAATRPPRDRLADARAVAAGMAAIHAAGIVHRDVTPQNVLRMSDGRLVVSDFGLASDASTSVTSIHGGTIAYMAPEVLRGEKGTRASDVWSLGVVIHEAVFGRRPDWDTDRRGGRRMKPTLGLDSTPAERAIERVCERCTAEKPRGRPSSAGEVLALVEGAIAVERDGPEGWPARVWGKAKRRWRSGLVAIVIVVAAAWGQATLRHLSVRRSQARDSSILIAGTIPDWTNSSRIITAVEGRIHCLSLLPDARHLRFIWGVQRHAEDVEITTGIRTPSNLTPDSYRDGCPQLSPDGKQLIYEGYDERAPHIVYSNSPDGSNPRAIVSSAEPTLSSEPKWLASNDSFIFDIDTRHEGVFYLESNRFVVIPDFVSDHVTGLNKFVNAEGTAIGLIYGDSSNSLGETIVRVEWPSLRIIDLFQINAFALDWTWQGSDLLGAGFVAGSGSLAFRVDAKSHHAKAVGSIGNADLRYITSLHNAEMAFVSYQTKIDIWFRDQNGRDRPLTNDGNSNTGSMSPEGKMLVSRYVGGRSMISLYRPDGGLDRWLTDGPADLTPGFLSNSDWIFSKRGSDKGVFRCSLSHTGCTRLYGEFVYSAVPSTDGRRIAILTSTIDGLRVAWIPADGNGGSHDVSESEAGCNPYWTAPDRLWISRRRRGRPVWVEMNPETRDETGRTEPGAKDCMEGTPDPAEPRHGPIWTTTSVRSEIRRVSLERGAGVLDASVLKSE